jgi:hypothetical protein
MPKIEKPTAKTDHENTKEERYYLFVPSDFRAFVIRFNFDLADR